MDRRRVAIVLIAITTVILFAGCNDDRDFTLGISPPIEIVGLKSGELKTGSTFLGKPLVIDFWASWCQPCRELMPDVSSLAKEFKGRVNVIGVSSENPYIIKSFWKTSGNDYKAYFDRNSFTNLKFKIREIPTIAVLDANGKLVYEVTAPDINSVRKTLNALLGIKQ